MADVGMPVRAAARSDRPLASSSSVFRGVVGFALGVLVAVLVVPTHRSSTLSAGRGLGGGGSLGPTGSGGDGGAVPGVSGGPAGVASGGSGSATSGAGADLGGRPGHGPGGAGGGSAAVGGGGGGGAGGVTGAGSVAAVAPSTRGVGSSAVTVGVAYLNLGGVQYLGPDYDVGNVPAQWNAVIAGWTRRGLLPVNGRTIHLTFHNYSVLDASQQRSACASMIQDDHVFAVVAPEFFYQQGAECVAAENHTPLITSDGPTREVYQRSAPFLNTIMLSATDQLTNMVYWAKSRGLLAGHKVGAYYPNDPASQQLVDEGLKVALRRVGSDLASEATTADANGGPEDVLAVQRFKAAGVDLVVLMTSDLGFLQQADAQGYHPHYIGSDYNGYTTYLNAENFPADQFDGSPAVTVTDRGALAAGEPPSPAAQQCLADYNQASGDHYTVPPPGGHETAAYVYVMLACDEGSLLLKAMQTAGPNLTTATFVAALERIRGQQMAYFPTVSFGSARFEGVDQERTVIWHASCKCWQASGPPQPLSMP